MDLNEEIRDGYTISSEMKKVWQIQIRMAAHLLDVCSRNNIKIYADGGTLLGAVRHNAYIPWDDDMDFLMLRGDYDKLIALSHDEFKYPFFLQSAYTEKHYYRGHAQLRYADTSAVLPTDVFCNFNQGIFIDIFVYDSIPDKLDDKWRNRLNKADEIDKILGKRMYTNIRFNPKTWLDFFKNRVLSVFKSSRRLYMEFENLFSCDDYADSKRIACPMFKRETKYDNLIKYKEWYRDIVFFPFEDIMLPCPIDYDKVLSTQYGDDYMVPKKMASMHGVCVFFSTDKSYKIVLRRLRCEYYMNRIKLLLNSLGLNNTLLC